MQPDDMDDETWMEICDNAYVAAYEVDPHMSEREREAFTDKYIEQAVANWKVTKS